MAARHSFRRVLKYYARARLALTRLPAKRGRRIRAGKLPGFLAATLAVGVVVTMLVPLSQQAAHAATCPTVELLGTRGSGQAAQSSTATGLGQPLDTFNTDLQNLVTADGLTYGFQPNTYSAVPVAGLAGIINAIGSKVTLFGQEIGQYRWSVQQGEQQLNEMITSWVTGSCGGITKLVLAGYSQGAQVTGDVYQGLSGAALSDIFAVELFADPRFNGEDPVDEGDYDSTRNGTLTTGSGNTPRPLFTGADIVESWCHALDPICQSFFVYGPNTITTGFEPGNHTNYDTVGDTVNPTNDNTTYPQRAAEKINGRLQTATTTVPPDAAITQPGTLPAGEPVTLSAGESLDPEGSPLTYAWDLDGSGSYGTSTGAEPRVTYTFPSAGTYTVGLRVTNASNLSATASVIVTVADPGVYTAAPGAPVNVVSTPAPDFTSATLTWSPPASGPPADGYVIYSDGIPVQYISPGQPLSFTLDSAQLPLPVVVVSYNGAGEGGSSTETVMSDATVVPDNNLNTMWNTYGNEGGHWTGADATISTQLPDGRDAWLFSDTYLGTVNADGSRPSDTPLVVHNSMVVQQGAPDGAVLTTLTGGTASAPTSLVGTADQGTNGIYGLQANSEFVDGGSLYAFYMAYATGSNGPLSNSPQYVVLAQFSLPSLTLVSTTELPALEPSKLWGMAVVQDSTYVYVYGNGNNGLYVARVPLGSLTGSASDPTQSWQFWTGSAWSSDETQAVSVLNGVAGLSVQQVDGQYVLVTFDSETAFDNNIVAYTASAAQGPFGSKQYLYAVPPQPSCSACFAYYPQLHQEFASSGQLVISYNVDSLNPQDVYANVMNYRPVFIDVAWPQAQPPASDLPAAPTSLTGSAGGTGIQLSWTASTTADVSYHIYSEDITKGETSYSRIGDTSQTSFLVSNLTSGDTYQFEVTAYNSNGDSPPSNSVTETFTLSPPATAPANLTATAQPDGSVNLSWDPVATAGWYTIQDEDVTAGDTTFSPIGPGIAGTTYTAQNLAVGHTYEFEVVANNNGGAGPPSAPATATVYVTPPTAPTGLTATANNDGTISLSWTTPGSGCPCWYWVYYQDATTGTAYTKYLDETTTAELTYLNIGDTYNIKVSATNRGGEGPATDPVSAVSYMPLPGAPQDLTATANSDGTISLSWTAPTGCLNCWYYVYYADATTGQGYTSYLDEGTTATLTYLNIGDTYNVKVSATNAAGEGPATSPIQVVPTMPLPSAPENLQVTANNDGTISMSWDPPSDCPDCWYYVYYRDATTGATFTSYLDTTTTATLTYLNIGDNYEVKVTATNAAGQGPATPSVTIEAYVPPPAAPQDLAATPGDGQISLSWSAPSSGCPCDYYVYYRDVTAGQSSFTSYLDTTTTADITYLVDGDSYEIYVTATNANGEGPSSNTVRATPKMPRPTAPTGLTATANDDGTISLSWNAPSNCPCWYFVYYRDATTGTGYTSYLDTATTAKLTYLDVGDEYQVYVRAANEGGVGPASDTVSATSYIPPPSAPSDLNVSAHTDGETVSLSWSAPGSGCPCWYYVYYRDASANGSWESYLDTTTTATLTFLTTGDTYQVYVSATNAGGEGPGTAITTVVPEIPAPKLSECLQGFGGNGVLLCWTAANPTGAFWIYVNGNRLEYPVIGQDYLYVGDLGPGTYTMYVTAVGNGGESPPSNTVTFVVPAAPQPPTAYISGSGCTFPNLTGFTCMGVSGLSYPDSGSGIEIGGSINTYPPIEDIGFDGSGWCGTLYFTISSGPDAGYYPMTGFTCSGWGWPAYADDNYGVSFPAGAQICFGGTTSSLFEITYRAVTGSSYSPPTGPACATAKPYS